MVKLKDLYKQYGQPIAAKVQNAINSPKLNFVDRLAKNQVIQGMANTGADALNLASKAIPQIPYNNKIVKNVTTNIRDYTASNAPTTRSGKIQRFNGENVPAMLLPASKGIQATKIASPAARLLANSGIKGLENAAYTTGTRIARNEQISPKQIVTDVATGALFNTALSPFELLGRPGILGNGRQGAVGELVQNTKEIKTNHARFTPYFDKAAELARIDNITSFKNSIANSPWGKGRKPSEINRIADDLWRSGRSESQMAQKLFNLDNFNTSYKNVQINDYRNMSPGFVKLPNGKYTTNKIPEKLFMDEKGAQVYDELVNATAGSRNAVEVNGQGGTREWSGAKSTFPDWVPADLRKRELFDKVQQHLIDGTIPTEKRAADLYDVVHNHLLEINGKPGIPLGDNTPLSTTPKAGETRPLVVRTEPKATPQTVQWPVDKPIPANSRARTPEQELAGAPTPRSLKPLDQPNATATRQATKTSSTESTPLTRIESTRNPNVSQVDSFDSIVQKTPVENKVGILDYLRTPDRVLNKIGLGKEADFIRKRYDKYQTELPVEIDKITKWASQTTPEENQRIFKYLDGK